MSTFDNVKNLIEARDNLLRQIENDLLPLVNRYTALLHSIEARGYTTQELNARNFDQYDDRFFIFKGPEYYEHGEYITPTLEIPEAFFEDPNAYETQIRKEIKARRAKESARKTEAARKRVEYLQQQLETAEESLKKATEEGTDPIKIESNQNRVDDVRKAMVN